MNVPDAAIGAILAAVVAGLLSLVGLIVTKEQKTSEFRQAWIDALRQDFTNYLTQVNTICDFSGVTYKSLAEKLKACGEYFRILNQSTFNISLRLNAEESEAQSVLTAMKEFQTVLITTQIVNLDVVRAIELRFLLSSKALLKKEWKRVKRGEPVFILAQIVAGSVILAAGFFIVHSMLSDTTSSINQGSYMCARQKGLSDFVELSNVSSLDSSPYRFVGNSALWAEKIPHSDC